MRGIGRLIASVRLIAVLTMGSRLLGLLREAVFARYFGTSELLSAFRIAFMAPNLARRLFGEGALSSAMIPILTETLRDDGDEAARRFVGTLLTLLVVVLTAGVLVAEGAIAAWRSVHDDRALQLAALLMPYMALICVVAAGGAALNVRRHFGTPAAVPMVLNLCILLSMLGAVRFADLSGPPLMYVVCGSVLVAGMVQLLVTGAALRAISFFPIFGWWRDRRMASVARLMAPMVLGLSAVQINSLVDYVIAYLFVFEDGERVGTAVLAYAQHLYQLPLGVFGIAVATAVFPMLTKAASEGDHRGLADILARGMRLALFIALPASAGLMIVAAPLVGALFQRGQFDGADTARVAGALFYYGLGLPAYFLQHLLVRAFYARQDSATPARVALAMVGVNFVMNVALVFVMEERGLALATALCAFIQVAVLAVKLRARVPDFAWRELGRRVLRIASATLFMACTLLAARPLGLVNDTVGAGPALDLLTLVAIGLATYAVSAKVLGIEELGMILRRSADPPTHG